VPAKESYLNILIEIWIKYNLEIKFWDIKEALEAIIGEIDTNLNEAINELLVQTGSKDLVRKKNEVQILINNSILK
jgi:hypothetical protein